MKKTPLLLLLLMLLFACEREPVNPNEPVNKKTVKDHEGNEYAIKTYGNQTWMVENMKAKTTKDGRNILKCPANGQFSYENPMAYYVYDKEEYTTDGRGYLYNFAAANQICPDGWHLPSKGEYQALADYIDREYTGVYNDDLITVAKAMASKQDWHQCDTVVGAPGYHSTSNNSSGFNLRPVGGYFTVSGTSGNPDFHGYYWRTYLWTSTCDLEIGVVLDLVSNRDTVSFYRLSTFQASSVRCMKDNNIKNKKY